MADSAEERESGAWSSSGDGEDVSPGDVDEVSPGGVEIVVESNDEEDEDDDGEGVEEDDGEGEKEDEEEDESSDDESSDESSDGDLPPAQIVAVPSMDEEALGTQGETDILERHKPGDDTNKATEVLAGGEDSAPATSDAEDEEQDGGESAGHDSAHPNPPADSVTSTRDGVVGSSRSGGIGSSVNGSGGSFKYRQRQRRAGSSGSVSPGRDTSSSLARVAMLQMARRTADSPASAPRGFSALDMMPSLDSGESLQGGSSSDGEEEMGGAGGGDDDSVVSGSVCSRSAASNPNGRTIGSGSGGRLSPASAPGSAVRGRMNSSPTPGGGVGGGGGVWDFFPGGGGVVAPGSASLSSAQNITFGDASSAGIGASDMDDDDGGSTARQEGSGGLLRGDRTIEDDGDAWERRGDRVARERAHRRARVELKRFTGGKKFPMAVGVVQVHSLGKVRTWRRIGSLRSALWSGLVVGLVGVIVARPIPSPNSSECCFPCCKTIPLFASICVHTIKVGSWKGGGREQFPLFTILPENVECLKSLTFFSLPPSPVTPFYPKNILNGTSLDQTRAGFLFPWEACSHWLQGVAHGQISCRRGKHLPESPPFDIRFDPIYF